MGKGRHVVRPAPTKRKTVVLMTASVFRCGCFLRGDSRCVVWGLRGVPPLFCNGFRYFSISVPLRKGVRKYVIRCILIVDLQAVRPLLPSLRC